MALGINNVYLLPFDSVLTSISQQAGRVVKKQDIVGVTFDLPTGIARVILRPIYPTRFRQVNAYVTFTTVQIINTYNGLAGTSLLPSDILDIKIGGDATYFELWPAHT